MFDEGDNMTKQKKEFIDGLWMNTDYGKWILISSEGKIEEANEMLRKIQSEFPWNADQVSKELSIKVAKEFDSVEEYDEYIKMLDEENYDLVDFMISNDVFGYIYDILNQK